MMVARSSSGDCSQRRKVANRAAESAKLGDMETVAVLLPAELLRVAGLDGGDLSKEAARLLALELFRENRVSLARAAELCQTPLATFMDFAEQHEVSPLRYVNQELEEDRQALTQLGL
jgi:predicted HTH domain antitoxin